MLKLNHTLQSIDIVVENMNMPLKVTLTMVYAIQLWWLCSIVLDWLF